jgi:hypothetical protein
VTMPIVERLQDAAMTFHGSSINRGCVDCGLSGTLADEAADTIEELVALLTDALDYVPPFLELSERGHALLAKIGGAA